MTLGEFRELMWDDRVFAVTNVRSFERYYETGMSLESYSIESGDVLFTIGKIDKGYRLEVYIKDVFVNAEVKAFATTEDLCILVAIDFENEGGNKNGC